MWRLVLPSQPPYLQRERQEHHRGPKKETLKSNFIVIMILRSARSAKAQVSFRPVPLFGTPLLIERRSTRVALLTKTLVRSHALASRLFRSPASLVS
mmetsp:Transcript_149/g.426  ORF Transcript_149/g.426 Transcript_149/m.426 type:complete len:97 (+) Transcript_149:193-483(+)